MVSWFEVGIGFVVGMFVICFFVVVAAAIWLFRERSEFNVRMVQARNEALSKVGVQARETYRARRQAAILEAVGVLKDGKGKDLKQLLMPIAAKYPDVAVQLMKNPQMILDDVRKMGLSLPPEIAEQLGEVQMPPS